MTKTLHTHTHTTLCDPLPQEHSILMTLYHILSDDTTYTDHPLPHASPALTTLLLTSSSSTMNTGVCSSGTVVRENTRLSPTEPTSEVPADFYKGSIGGREYDQRSNLAMLDGKKIMKVAYSPVITEHHLERLAGDATHPPLSTHHVTIWSLVY